MSNDEHCVVAHHSVQRLLHNCLAVSIQSRGGLQCRTEGVAARHTSSAGVALQATSKQVTHKLTCVQQDWQGAPQIHHVRCQRGWAARLWGCCLASSMADAVES